MRVSTEKLDGKEPSSSAASRSAASSKERSLFSTLPPGSPQARSWCLERRCSRRTASRSSRLLMFYFILFISISILCVIIFLSLEKEKRIKKQDRVFVTHQSTSPAPCFAGGACGDDDDEDAAVPLTPLSSRREDDDDKVRKSNTAVPTSATPPIALLLRCDDHDGEFDAPAPAAPARAGELDVFRGSIWERKMVQTQRSNVDDDDEHRRLFFSFSIKPTQLLFSLSNSIHLAHSPSPLPFPK